MLIRLHEYENNLYRLGRHINHDERSRAFRVPQAAQLESRLWPRQVPIFDQGQLGSCTGNAAVGSLATNCMQNFGLKVLADGTPLDQDLAICVYAKATEIDPYDGIYPPNDTGSDGLSVAKVLKNMGIISSYTHGFGLQDLLSALQDGPAICGTNWYSSMFYPIHGKVEISTGAYVAGGHEFCAVGVDMENRELRFANSWGTSWGDLGYMNMSFATMERLLSENGDITVFRPTIQAPPPLPQPCNWLQMLLKWLSLGLYEPNCR